MIIDFEHHLFMQEELQKGNSKSGKIYERYWDQSGRIGFRIHEEASHVDRYLQFMDEAGIDVAVLTTNRISGLEQTRRWNDFCAKVVRENPKRFVGFACIPPPSRLLVASPPSRNWKGRSRNWG